MSAPVRNLAHIGRDRGYRFVERDPVLDDVTRAITDSGVGLAYIEQRSGVTTGTLRRWQAGKTKRPQNFTVEFVLRALGYRRVLVGPN